MAFAPIVPEGVGAGAVLAALLLSLASVLAWLACSGLLKSWDYSLGFLLRKIGDALDFTILGHHIGLGGLAHDANNTVRHQLSLGIAAAEVGIAKGLHAAGVIARWMVSYMHRSADVMLHSLEWLIHTYIPGRASWAASILFPPALIAKLIRSEARKLLPAAHKAAHAAAEAETTIVYRYPKAIERRIAKDEKILAGVAAAVGATGVALPRPLPWPSLRRSVKELEAWRRVTAKRLHKLEALLAASGLALAVANMTGTRVKCWRGQGNIARALRHICGVPKWLIDLAILGTVEAFIAADLCEFSWLLQKQAEAIRPAIMELVDVEDALIGCHGVEKNMIFQLPAAALPPLQAASPLAA